MRTSAINGMKKLFCDADAWKMAHGNREYMFPDMSGRLNRNNGQVNDLNLDLTETLITCIQKLTESGFQRYSYALTVTILVTRVCPRDKSSRKLKLLWIHIRI